MPDKPLPTDLPVHFFGSPAALEAHLNREHTTAPGLYLKLARKATGIPCITVAQAIEVLLCFGWIDGQGRGLDDSFYLLRVTPRRSKSLWSQKNVDTVGRLLEQGQMRPAGLAAVDAAKADGRWERAYAGPATVTVPDDLTLALSREPEAAAVFEGLNKTNRYSVLWRVHTATPQNRANRVQMLVQKLKEGGDPRKWEPKTVQTSKTQQTKKREAKKSVPRKTAAVKNNDPTPKPRATVAASSHGQAREEPRRSGLRPRK